MARVLILHASCEGQTARIAGRIAQKLRDMGHVADIIPAKGFQAGFGKEKYDAVMVGASIHYGHHPAYLRTLLRRHCTAGYSGAS